METKKNKRIEIERYIKKVLLKEFNLDITDSSFELKFELSSIQYVSFILNLEEFFNVALSNKDDATINSIVDEIIHGMDNAIDDL